MPTAFCPLSRYLVKTFDQVSRRVCRQASSAAARTWTEWWRWCQAVTSSSLGLDLFFEGYMQHVLQKTCKFLIYYAFSWSFLICHFDLNWFNPSENADGGHKLYLHNQSIWTKCPDMTFFFWKCCCNINRRKNLDSNSNMKENFCCCCDEWLACIILARFNKY